MKKRTLVTLQILAALTFVLALLSLPRIAPVFAGSTNEAEEKQSDACTYATISDYIFPIDMQEVCVVGCELTVTFDVHTETIGYYVDYSSEGFTVEGIWQNDDKVEVTLIHLAESSTPTFTLSCIIKEEALA